MRTIITVTVNPALDKTAECAQIATGGLNRLSNVTADAGGKGVNVSKAIAALGGKSIATGFAGGGAGRGIESALRGLGVATDFVSIGGQTRTNTKIISRDGLLTEFNEPGPSVTPDETASLRQKLVGYAGQDAVFAFAGSLAGGMAPDAYEEMILLVKDKGSAVSLDADGEAFKLALAAKPDIVKPNGYELAQYFGLERLPDMDGLAELCGRLIGVGAGLVALSMGRDGAMFVTASEALYAPGLSVAALSAVGAGDCMVGALLYGFCSGMGLREAAALSVAASAGAVATRGTNPPARAVVDGLLKQVNLVKIR